jgi:hypothetical protein
VSFFFDYVPDARLFHLLKVSKITIITKLSAPKRSDPGSNRDLPSSHDIKTSVRGMMGVKARNRIGGIHIIMREPLSCHA